MSLTILSRPSVSRIASMRILTGSGPVEGVAFFIRTGGRAPGNGDDERSVTSPCQVAVNKERVICKRERGVKF